MIYRDPKCVFVANNPVEADIVACWLGERGILAQVMNRATLGGLEGLTPFSLTGVGTVGLEVWVQDPTQASHALQILAEHAAARETNDHGGQAIETICEQCGERMSLTSAPNGSPHQCPHCGAPVHAESESEGTSRAFFGPEGDEEDGEDDQEAPANGMSALRSLRRPIALLMLAPPILGLGILALAFVIWLANTVLRSLN
jgi:Putative prokaryotic signal transducing protein